MGSISRQKLKKRKEKNVAFFKRRKKNGTFWTEKNAVPNPALNVLESLLQCFYCTILLHSVHLSDKYQPIHKVTWISSSFSFSFSFYLSLTFLFLLLPHFISSLQYVQKKLLSCLPYVQTSTSCRLLGTYFSPPVTTLDTFTARDSHCIEVQRKHFRKMKSFRIFATIKI